MGAAVPHSFTPRRPAGTPAALVGADITTLERIFDADCAIAAWRPPSQPDLGAWLEAHLPEREVLLLERIPAQAPELDALLEMIVRGAAHSPLAAFVRQVVDVYAILADADRVGVRFCITRGQPCPRFHVDRVGLRLICTLRGRGTEWLAPEDVDRGRLGSHDADDDVSGIVRPGARVQRLEALDVALFKGEAWPANGGRGAVHRSPAADGTWRAMLTLDAV